MKISLLEIFKVFFIIGLQLLGGGYVIVPLLKKYLVEERHWLNEEELTDFFALSQCIPGIIAGNIAVCAGHKVRGILGAITALLGIIVPCFLAILIIVQLISGFTDNQTVQNAFKGIRISVVVLIFITIKELWSKSVNSVFSYFLFFAIFAALCLLPISPVFIIISAGLISLIYFRLKGVKNA